MKASAFQIESSIAFAARRFAAARTRATRLAAWGELKRLHSLRDAEQVARLEQKRGLR